jgi:hypothetical protein
MIQQQACTRVVAVDRLDGGSDLIERRGAVDCIFDRLRLDAAQPRRCAAFVPVRLCDRPLTGSSQCPTAARGMS